MKDFSILFEKEVINRVVKKEDLKREGKLKEIYDYFFEMIPAVGELIAFDLVYPLPETGEYNFITFVLAPESFDSEIQEMAKSDYYRENILSLSAILIEGHLERKWNLKLKDNYREWVILEREKGHQEGDKEEKPVLRGLPPYKKEEGDRRNIAKFKLEKEEENKYFQKANTILHKLLENFPKDTELKEKCIEKLGRYLAWVSQVGAWEEYHYLAIPISPGYRFGIVLLIRSLKGQPKKWVKDLKDQIREVFIDKFSEYFLNRLRRRTASVAMGAIMSRNMSHNLASHVLFYLSSELNPFIPPQEVSRFLRYLQQRMDFIAFITSASGYTVRTASFLIKDVLRRFLEQKILLHYIGWSENVNLKNLIIHCRFKGKEVLSLKDGRVELKDPSRGDVQVLFPLGMVGFHALYSILENILRNTAKHGFSVQKNAKENLELFIDIEEEEEEVVMRITDNIKWEKTEENKEKVENMRGAIFRPLVSQDGEVEPQNWGLKEIRICASFLYYHKHPEIFSKESWVDNLLERWSEERKDWPVTVELSEDGYLTYTLRLVKGREVVDARRNKHR